MRGPTQQQQYLDIKDAYVADGQPWPARMREMARWAIATGKYEPPPSDAEERLARLMADALAQEYITDPQGRSVRRNHAAQRRNKDGQFAWEWDSIDHASRPHMETALQTRRQAVVADCKQLKTDADSYNENYNPGEPIQLPLDFTNDVAEAEALEALTRDIEPALTG